MGHACGRAGMHTEFWCGNMKKRKTLESTRPKWKNDIKMQKKVRWEGIDVLFWLRMGVTGELLWVTNVQIPYKLENFLASFLRRALALWN